MFCVEINLTNSEVLLILYRKRRNNMKNISK